MFLTLLVFLVKVVYLDLQLFDLFWGFYRE